MKYLVLLIVLSSLSLSSCSSKKEKLSTAVSEQKTTPIIEKQFLDKGLVKALIVETEQDIPCRFLIKLDLDNHLLEPQTLDKSFQSDNLKVWIRYQMQRRKSSCNSAQPVKLIAIEKRE